MSYVFSKKKFTGSFPYLELEHLLLIQVQASPALGNNANVCKNMSRRTVKTEDCDMPYKLPLSKQSQIKMEETFTGQRNPI